MDAPLIARRRLFGLDFVDAVDVDPIVEVLLAWPTIDGATTDDGTLPIVVTPNVDHLVRLDRGDEAEAIRTASRARWVLPDGQPVVWASRLLKRPLRARLPGSDLVARLFPRLVEAQRTVLVVATSEAVALLLRAEPADVHVVVAPQLDLADRPSVDEFVDRCASIVESVQPSHVFVTLGFPKQCIVIDGLVRRTRPRQMPVMLAVGASFEMYYGLVRRAPVWMQRSGLEWLYRFIQEPRRLFRRYFVDDPAFLGIVWRELRHERTRS